MMRFLLCMVLLSGCANGKNGNDKNSHGTLKVESSQPTDPGLYLPRNTTTQGHDGQWWCFKLSGDLRPIDGRESCDRTKSYCEEMRTAARSQFGYASTECKPQQTAICFPYVVQTTGREGERCFITGTECERVFREIMGNTETTGCAIQTNDRPPTGGGTARRTARGGPPRR